MSSKEIYEYAIIRYVPKVERQEFMNDGVIVLCKKKKYLKMKYIIDRKRLLTFSADVDLDLIKDYLDGWNLVCEGAPKGGKIGELEIHVRFRWLTAARSTIIQSSEVHSGLCLDLDSTLDELFTKYVL